MNGVRIGEKNINLIPIEAVCTEKNKTITKSIFEYDSSKKDELLKDELERLKEM